MPATATEELKEMNARFLTLSKAAPRVLGAFRTLMNESSRDGLLPAKLKELVAVAIAAH